MKILHVQKFKLKFHLKLGRSVMQSSNNGNR